MAGYQEVLTDPSYAGQIVTMTSPHQGNYGMNDEDARELAAAGRRVRRAGGVAPGEPLAGAADAARRARGRGGRRDRGHRHAQADAADCGSTGPMRAAVSTVDLDAVSLVDRVRVAAGHGRRRSGEDRVAPRRRSTRSVVRGARRRDRGRIFRVAAYDFGMKRNILRLLADHGIRCTVFPAETPPATIAQGGFDGVFLSNGPGDPAATAYGIAAVRELLGKVPIFGICLGHQLLGLALGGRTYKMKFGHRGVNQPVKDLATGARRDHEPQPRVRGRSRRLVRKDGDGRALTDYGRVEPEPLEPQRRHPRGHALPRRARRSACSTTRRPRRAARFAVPLRGVPRDDGRPDLMPRRTDIRKIMVIGSGPIVIGQACEFDYSGTQACKVLRPRGSRCRLVNSNPATIMTDPEFADRTYIEPLTPASVLQILERERPDALLPTLGGQTGLNVSVALAESGDLDRLGVRMLGASLEAIRKAEDRSGFQRAMVEAGLDVPRSGIARTVEEAVVARGRRSGSP